ncbi:MAG TPA: OmpA family protein [Methylomirabilota bacterium]|nr:OmpA family protein [Methylomirabilota bacterium]
MRLVKAMAVLPPAALVLMSGCAGSTPAPRSAAVSSGDPSRVAATPAPSRDGQADERVSAVEGRLNEMNQRLDKMGNQVQKLEGGVVGAQDRAAAAQKRADGVDSRLTRLWSNRFNQKPADSLEVYFSPDSIDLTDAAQTALANVAKEMEAHPAMTVELGGYTDPRGALDYNYALSQRRVDAVRRFLVEKGIPLGRIQAASLGPISTGGIPDKQKRRVTIRLMVDQE